MSEKGVKKIIKKIEDISRGVASWLCSPLVLLGFFVILLVFYGLCLYCKSDWKVPILFFSFLLLSLIAWYYGTIFVCENVSQCYNKIKCQCSVILDLEAIALIIFLSLKSFNTLLNLLLGDIKLEIVVVLTMFFALFLLSYKIVLFLLSYKKLECWRKRVRANIEEWLLSDNSLDKLSWLVSFFILLTFVFVGIIILYHKYKSRSFIEIIKDNTKIIVSIFVTILGSQFSKVKALMDNKSEGSEYLFYSLSETAVIIWSIVLIIVYALIHSFILGSKQYSILQLLLVSFFYTLFILVLYYLIKKFFEVINFAMPAHRLQMKIKVLSHSPLNKNMLRLWNAFWRNREFGNALKEGAFLSDFVPKIAYHKRLFQLKEEVSVAADALRGFSDNINKRYSEALAREVLNIVPRRHTQPKRLPEYLVDVLNAYKDIVCNDKLVCEEPDFEISFYKRFFRSEANEFLPKYQYLDELIYQILVTLRKSIKKLRNDKYFEKHYESRRILCEKFNKFVDTLGNLECVSNNGKKGLRDALKTESAKKWIKEANALLRTINKANYYNCLSLLSDFTKALQTLKKFENLP